MPSGRPDCKEPKGYGDPMSTFFIPPPPPRPVRTCVGGVRLLKFLRSVGTLVYTHKHTRMFVFGGVPAHTSAVYVIRTRLVFVVQCSAVVEQQQRSVSGQCSSAIQPWNVYSFSFFFFYIQTASARKTPFCRRPTGIIMCLQQLKMRTKKKSYRKSEILLPKGIVQCTYVACRELHVRLTDGVFFSFHMMLNLFSHPPT